MAKRTNEDSSEEDRPAKRMKAAQRRHSPEPEEQAEMDHELLEEMSPLIQPFDAGEWFADLFRKTPYWAIAVAFHLLLIAVAGLIKFKEIVFKSEAPTVINVAAKAKSKVELPEQLRGIVDN